jgi:1,4-dihydroxy-2-naphthoate octaprenyltransferase
MGTFFAAAEGRFDLMIFILCALTAVFLQILSNLANDYGDYINGADSVFRVGPQRAVQAGEISVAAMKRAIYVFIFLSLVSGLYLLYLGIKFSPVNFFGFFTIGILAIIAAIKYTAGDKPYGYAGLGDISVFIFFGWVGVLGSYYLQAGTLNPLMILPATSCGLFSVAVLNINNLRDIESDRLAGKKSIPARIGRQKAKIYHWILLLLGILFTLVYTLLDYHHYAQFSFLLAVPLIIKNGIEVSRTYTPSDFNPFLRQMAMSTLIFVITFGIGLLIAYRFAF